MATNTVNENLLTSNYQRHKLIHFIKKNYDRENIHYLGNTDHELTELVRISFEKDLIDSNEIQALMMNNNDLEKSLIRACLFLFLCYKNKGEL